MRFFVRSDGATRRLGAQPRRGPFRAAESAVARVRGPGTTRLVNWGERGAEAGNETYNGFGDSTENDAQSTPIAKARAAQK